MYVLFTLSVTEEVTHLRKVLRNPGARAHWGTSNPFSCNAKWLDAHITSFHLNQYKIKTFTKWKIMIFPKIAHIAYLRQGAAKQFYKSMTSPIYYEVRWWRCSVLMVNFRGTQRVVSFRMHNYASDACMWRWFLTGVPRNTGSSASQSQGFCGGQHTHSLVVTRSVIEL